MNENARVAKEHVSPVYSTEERDGCWHIPTGNASYIHGTEHTNKKHIYGTICRPMDGKV